MAFGTRAGFEALRLVAFGSITNSYTALGAVTTGHVRIFCVTNTTNVDINISVDGTTNHLRIASGGFKLFDLTTNEVQNDGFFLSEGTQFYVKYPDSAPTSGNVWVELIQATSGGV